MNVTLVHENCWISLFETIVTIIVSIQNDKAVKDAQYDLDNYAQYDLDNYAQCDLDN